MNTMETTNCILSDWADRVEALIRNAERNAEELATFKSNVLRELPTLPKDTFPGEAAGNAIRDLREALQWYVDNDDTNDTPDNKFWLEGRERARKALGEFNPERNPGRPREEGVCCGTPPARAVCSMRAYCGGVPWGPNGEPI